MGLIWGITATYPHIREALAGWKGPVTIATKSHGADEATTRLHVEEALREIGREQLDIVHIHGKIDVCSKNGTIDPNG